MTQTAFSSGIPIVVKGLKVVREPERAVLSAEIEAADLAVPASMWFAVALRFADGLTMNGDPFLPTIVMRAMREHRALRIEDSVSTLLTANVRRVMDIHAAWSQDSRSPLRAVQLTTLPAARVERGPTAAAFFSEGVDSFYTVLKNLARYPRSDSRAISHLIVLHGLDVPLEDRPLFDKVEASAQEVAKTLGLELLTVRTNVREVLKGIDWGQHAHGAALASIALAFSRLFHTVFIASGSSFFALHPWGSHPGVDPLWSTETCELAHDGAEADRLQKIKYLASSSLALAHLRVCWKNPDGAYNCGRCEKCLRTMTILEAAGALARARTFPPRITPANVRALTIRPDQAHFWEATLQALRESASQRDLVAAIDEAIDRGRKAAGAPARFKTAIRQRLHRVGGRVVDRPVTAPAAKYEECRLRLRGAIEAALDPVVARFTECALVDFPAYPNVGDNAIWLGTVDYLRSRGVTIKYVCDPRNYSASELRRTVKEGPILIEGGGNFGDLWEDHQQLRERIVQDFPDRPIIQLPQSLHFTDPAKLEQARSIINAHPSFLLFVRDRASLALAQKHFSCETRLCPDLAFMMRAERLVRPNPRPGTIIYLCRSDKEAVTGKVGALLAAPGLIVADWIQSQSSRWRTAYERTSRWRRRPIRILQRLPPLASWKQSRRLAAANGMAQERVDYGRALLEAGQVVVTDRLHAHILATCLGLQNVVFDNSYGKVAAFVREWMRDVPGVAFCGGEAEAIAKAREMALPSSQYVRVA